MAVTMLCPNLKCRCVLQVPESVRGKQVRCSHCGTSLMVPAGKNDAPRTDKTAPPAQKK